MDVQGKKKRGTGEWMVGKRVVGSEARKDTTGEAEVRLQHERARVVAL